MQACRTSDAPPFTLGPSLPFPAEDWADAERQLRIKVLTTARQREVIAELRKHAPMGVEDDLGAGLMPYESLRDEIGLVTAVYRDAKLVATLRFVPSGQGLTAAERVRGAVGGRGEILGRGNWEVGRLVLDPEVRSPEALQRCLSLALQTLVEAREVEHLYAIATPVMARLWRRFALHPVAPLRGASGRAFSLVAGHVTEVAAALEVPLPGRPTLAAVPVHCATQLAIAA